MTVMVLPWQHNMLSLITPRESYQQVFGNAWYLKMISFETLLSFSPPGTAVGSPGGGQSKQKQAHPAVTESIDNDTPHYPNKVFTDTCWACFQKPPCHRDLVPNHLKIASTVSIASSRWDRHLLETSCILPGELLPLPAILPAQDLVP